MPEPIGSEITVPAHLANSNEEPLPARLARVNRPGVLVSVVVNHFERELTIYRVVERVMNQQLSECSAGDIEVVVVDDGSEHGTLAERLPDSVTYVWQRRDRYGIARAKNLGAKIANGKYIVFLDADILVAETYLDAVVQAFHQWDQRVVHCGYIWDYHGPDTPDPRTEFGVWENPGIPTGRFFQIAGGNLAIARSLFVESGGFDEDLVFGGVEDLLFGYQLCNLPRTAVRFDQRMTAWHLPHPPSAAHADPAASWNVVKTKYPTFYDSYIVKGLR
jgi:glycosyltransferase involved in cell wall biosynthesis